ncbi:MAG: YfhO family protein, partial [Bacteroidia bacterium]
SYSNGWTDLGATIIPNYSGGDSDKLGLYYGDIGSTSGPKYIGVTIFMLMLLGLALLKGPKKWWLLGTMLVTIVLSMGGNHFTGINTFMYEHFPLYNKFRAPSMMMVLVQISAGLLAILGLEKLLSTPELSKDDFKKLKIAGISGVAILVLLSFTGTMFNDFSSNPKEDENGTVVYDADTRYAQMAIQRQGGEANQGNIDRFKDQLVEMRLDAMQKDGKRSLFFALCILLVVWLAYKNKLENKYIILLTGLLITADLWFVGKRYLDDKDFKKTRKNAQTFAPYEADLEIQKDTAYYRVLDLTVSTLNSNRCAYFHKSIGGYSAAKLRRFQDLWDWHLIEDLGNGNILDNGILNMLNMKYFIYPNRQQQGGPPRYGQNANALGNAWIVSNVQVVDNADSAILGIKKINTAKAGLVESNHADLISQNTNTDSNATIELVSYHPEKLDYEYNSSQESNVAFSEVYYDKGWQAYIDNEPVDHYRMNYIIRGLKVPAGSHDISFRFEPSTYKTGKMLSTTFGAIIYVLIGLALFTWVRKEFLTKEETA